MFDILQLFIAQADSRRSAEKLRMCGTGGATWCLCRRSDRTSGVGLEGARRNAVVVFIYDSSTNELTHVHMHMRTHACTHIHIYIYILHIYIYILYIYYIYIYITYIYIYIYYIYIYILLKAAYVDRLGI